MIALTDVTSEHANVLLHGRPWGRLTQNTHGYCGTLPAPAMDGSCEPDEVGVHDLPLVLLHELVLQLNSEWEVVA